MSDIYLDLTTGDIDLSNNTPRLTNTNAEEVRQKVEVRLRTLRGEWFANTLAGVPYLQQMLGRNVGVNLIDTQIKTTTMNTSGVININSFTSTLNKKTRTYTATMTVATSEGIVVITFTP